MADFWPHVRQMERVTLLDPTLEDEPVLIGSKGHATQFNRVARKAKIVTLVVFAVFVHCDCSIALDSIAPMRVIDFRLAYIITAFDNYRVANQL